MTVAEHPPMVRLVPIEGEPGKVRLQARFHDGQAQARRATKRIVAVIAGTQSGKTSWAPFWLRDEMKARGPGDYLVATPTFPLLELKALPEFRRLFETQMRYGRYVGSPTRRFIFNEDGCIRLFGSYDPEIPTQVFFAHAQDPDSLESATVKAAWLDEAGQKKFRLGSFEAVMRRLSIAQGRLLITTTPYDLGWLKQKIFDPWQQARQRGEDHPDIDVINFESTMNPAFPLAEFERARRELPPWKFDLFYRGIFTRPAGMIYDAFDEDKHLCKRFEIPDDWPRYIGLDFGPVHTAAVFLAEKPNTRNLYVYRTYQAGSVTTKQHVEALLKGEPLDPTTDLPRKPKAYGGSASEDEWRDEFMGAGLYVNEPPVSEVETGITRVYGAMRRDELLVFDDLDALRADIMSYSREVDDAGNVLEAIEDKSTWHRLDALRYIVAALRTAPSAGLQRVRPVVHGKQPFNKQAWDAQQQAQQRRVLPSTRTIRRGR